MHIDFILINISFLYIPNTYYALSKNKQVVIKFIEFLDRNKSAETR